MIKNVYQCCYTNASRQENGIVSSGWQAVSVSPDLPKDAYNYCTKIQNANSRIQSAMVDEKGNVLNLIEISGDGSYIYFIRTKYGMLDRLGRANMFSHAYIMPCKDQDFIANPNNYLTIANENFKENEEDASADSEAVIRLPEFNINKALEACGMDLPKYVRLIKSVYAQVSDKKAMRPLYIEYDGTEDNLRNLLFCIYTGLPLAIRRNMSIASMETYNTVNKNIFFTVNAKDHEQYCIPTTGESTILTDKVDRRLNNLGFLTLLLKYVSDPSYNLFIKKIENSVISYGDPSASDELLLKVAFAIMMLRLKGHGIDTKSDNEILLALSDALRSKSLGIEEIDKYINVLLHECSTRNLVLSDEICAALSTRVAATRYTELAKSFDSYNMKAINNMSSEDAIAKLSKLSGSELTQYCNSLKRTSEGISLLKKYYADTVINNNNVTWKDIDNALSSLASIGSDSLIENRILDRARELISSQAQLYSGDIKNFIKQYDECINAVSKILKGLALENFVCDVKKDYWSHVDIVNISFDQYEDYAKIDCKDEMCQHKLRYCELADIFFQDGDIRFFEAASIFFADHYESNNNDILKNRLIDYLINQSRVNIQNFDFWCRLFFDLRSQQAFYVIADLYQCTKYTDRIDTNQVHACIIELNRIKREAFPPYIGKNIAAYVFNIYKQYDRPPYVLMLDKWLVLGQLLYDNCFYIFDDYRPGLSEADDLSFLQASLMVRDRQFLMFADHYVQNKGKEAKMVKKWISYCDNPDGSSGGFLSKVFGKK